MDRLCVKSTMSFFGYGGGKIDNSYDHGINWEISEFIRVEKRDIFSLCRTGIFIKMLCRFYSVTK